MGILFQDHFKNLFNQIRISGSRKRNFPLLVLCAIQRFLITEQILLPLRAQWKYPFKMTYSWTGTPLQVIMFIIMMIAIPISSHCNSKRVSLYKRSSFLIDILLEYVITINIKPKTKYTSRNNMVQKGGFKMGREFVDIFDGWADSYDASVSGKDPEYRDVFEGYETILNEVAKRVSGTIIEFGTGTGNLTAKLLEAGNSIIGIEPNTKMLEVTAERFPSINLIDGDLLEFNVENEHIDAIVSTYVFHHLIDEEKGIALKKYASLLPANGKVVFADTVFLTEEAKQAQISKERNRGFLNVVEDLEREYYTTIPILEELFTEAGFQVGFLKMNDYVWLMDATKK